MRTIRLIREVSTDMADNGPQNGQAVLQAALREYAPPWLVVGGELQLDDIPWYWCWRDATEACECAAAGRPFVMGPNIFFHSADWPGRVPQEQILLSASSCKLVFTESAWYAALIAKHLKSGVPVSIWPYPIAPQPEPQTNLEACDVDLMIYAKSGVDLRHLATLGRTWRNSRLIAYGHYQRYELQMLARRSRCCLYVSASDRGPLALAEILLCGCPAAGIRQGAPWIEHGINGGMIPSWCCEDIAAGVSVALGCDRVRVAEEAQVKFMPANVVRQIVEQLETYV
jgi:hypothetical protein